MTVSPAASSENARRTMQANRRVSGVEMRYRVGLRRAGLVGYRVSMRLPGRPDVVFTRARVAVFVHGCFWHRCPTCNLPRPKAHSEFWDAKFAENLLRDTNAEAALVADGWLTIVVWEHEIETDLPGVVARTHDIIRRRLAAGR